MKGRTLADQKKMKVGGVTKMQAGRSVPGMKDRMGRAMADAGMRGNMPAAPGAKYNRGMEDRMGRAMFRADVLGNRPTPSAPPQPMMSKGGKTYRKGGKC
jgi:hypothetical protein